MGYFMREMSYKCWIRRIRNIILGSKLTGHKWVLACGSEDAYCIDCTKHKRIKQMTNMIDPAEQDLPPIKFKPGKLMYSKQEELIKKQTQADLEILKQFILGFTARNVDKEWEAFKNIRTALLGENI